MAFSINSNFKNKLNQQLEEDKKASKVTKVTKAGKVQKDTKAHEDTKVQRAHRDANTSSRGKSRVQSKEPEAEVTKEMLVKDNGKGYKEYLEVSVKRFGEEGIPYVHFSTRVESEMYNGYKKGKHISFPLEFLYEFLDLMNEVDEECDKKHIE